MKNNEWVYNEWVFCTIKESSRILEKIPGLKPGDKYIMIDTRKKSIRVKDEDLKKEYKPIIFPTGKDALDILEGVTKSSKDKYRFNCALQTGKNTVVPANGEWDKPPTAKEAIEVLERLRVKGKRFLPNKAHEDFDTAINEAIGWLKQLSGTGLTPNGGYDIDNARGKFEYKGTKYRVDIKASGKTSGESWFK